MDLGRRPLVRYTDHLAELHQTPINREDIAHVVAAVGEFGGDNRAGIEGTLHRISAIRNRRGEVIGLTLRVGRAVSGTLEGIRDLVQAGHSLLLLGRPGVGKTTRLRESARLLADELGRRVMVVDTSNEIAGDGDLPHPGIGSARRMQVPHPAQQHALMIEAVENHMPEAIIVDEIGNAGDAMAARTIAERGVQLIATAHGNDLHNLVMNPTLADLVGGVQTVTLGDDEARLRGTRKSVNERKAPPTFDAVIELASREELVIHRDTAAAVDRILAGRHPDGTHLGAEPATFARDEEQRPCAPATGPGSRARRPRAAVYAHAVSRDSLERVIRDLALAARTVRHPEQASVVVALQARARDPRLRRAVELSGAEVHTVKRNSTAQIRRALQSAFHIVPGVPREQVEAALREAETAVAKVQDTGDSVALGAHPGALRRLQHQVIVAHRLIADSEGSGPGRHLVIRAP